MISAYFIHLFVLIGIYLILAMSFQLSAGFGGLLNLGHIAFFGIGAYVYALLLPTGLDFWLCILSSGLFTAFFGWLLALAVRKLRGDYLAIVTLGFSFVVYSVLLNWTKLTNGPLGISNIARPVVFGQNTNDNIAYLILVLAIAVVSYLFIYKVTSSSFGRIIEAIREDETSASSLGKKTFKVKWITLAVSAFFAGTAGCLYASYLTYIDPGAFTFSGIIPILLIVIIGGLGSLPGTIIATIFIILLPEPLRFVGYSSSIIGPVRQIAYAVIILLVLYYKPKGFLGKLNL